jgi:hypothetical protein
VPTASTAAAPIRSAISEAGIWNTAMAPLKTVRRKPTAA